ncbi:MAG: dihydropteroate synthase [Endozoicomonas sp. (ex Botrylloides leachii)]|nr:dihydropteroate synthase [Endozoicomonas sp. (ex Botrylloides leachii)]
MSKCFELNCSGKTLNLSSPKIMGILNVTSDSFYAASRCTGIDDTLKRAEVMAAAGAAILDVGGESTSAMVQRYGYKDTKDAARYVGGISAEHDVLDVVSCEQELDRIIPVVEALSQRFDCIISVDTSSAAVIRESALAGAGIINDIRALNRPGALEAVAATDLPVVLMHSLVDHPEAGFIPHYDNLMMEVTDYLKKAVIRCEEAGIQRHRLIIDPGFGGGLFGKTPDYDLSMLKHFKQFHELELPILAGLSRKSFIGAILDKGPEQRLTGSLSAAIIAAQAGAHILRVHDVAETYDVLRVLQAVNDAH